MPDTKSAARSSLAAEDKVFVREGDRCWFVPVKNIRLLESEGNYTRLHFDDQKPQLFRSLTAMEERLNAVVVTPRMHGIHHSTRAEETDSNFSSLLSCWDRLHRSLRLDVPQRSVTIGVAGFTHAEDVTLERSLTLPFREDPRLLPPAAIPVN